MSDVNAGSLLSWPDRKGFVVTDSNFLFLHNGNSLYADHPVSRLRGKSRMPVPGDKTVILE